MSKMNCQYCGGQLSFNPSQKMIEIVLGSDSHQDMGELNCQHCGQQVDLFDAIQATFSVTKVNGVNLQGGDLVIGKKVRYGDEVRGNKIVMGDEIHGDVIRGNKNTSVNATGNRSVGIGDIKGGSITITTSDGCILYDQDDDVEWLEV